MLLFIAEDEVISQWKLLVMIYMRMNLMAPVKLTRNTAEAQTLSTVHILAYHSYRGI